MTQTKAQLGGSAVLRCKVEIPNGKIQASWFKDGVLLMPGDQYTMHLSETGELALTISPVTANDEGYYTCHIENESGQMYCEAPLFLDGKSVME